MRKAATAISNSSGAINVGAISTKEVLSYAVTAGIGGSVGIGATVGVIIIGTNTADPDTQGEQTGQLNQGNNGTIASVNAGTNSSHGSDAVASGTSGNPSNANATSTYDVSTVLTGGNDGVTAQIAGGNVTGTQVNVAATSANATKMFLLGAGFGKNVGIGAGIGYTSVNSSVLANLSAIVAAPSVTVAARVKDADTGPYSGKTVDSEAIAGGAALYFGADAAVAVGNVANTVTAQLGGSVTGTGGTGVAVMAMDSSTQSVTAGGGTGGLAAIGVSIATTGRSSSVAAKVLSNATVNSSTLAVGAAEAGAMSASATAVAGGIVAGDGAVATAKENSTVLAEIGSGASITTSAAGVGTLVSASLTPNLSSEAIGVAVGGGAIGVSVAVSMVDGYRHGRCRRQHQLLRRCARRDRDGAGSDERHDNLRLVARGRRRFADRRPRQLRESVRECDGERVWRHRDYASQRRRGHHGPERQQPIRPGDRPFDRLPGSGCDGCPGVVERAHLRLSRRA